MARLRYKLSFKKMAIAAKHRPLEYGHRPMASQFDQDEDRNQASYKHYGCSLI
jgi:hypothetical protein